MSDPVARAWAVTRRTFGATLLGALGLAAVETWPRWAFWRGAASSLDALAGLPQAAALKALGRQAQAAMAIPAGYADTLAARLGDEGYAGAVARDRAEGRLVSIDGWLVPETQALAGLWLASAG
ncbi:MAG: hypothetical protein IT548_11480 [Alphaproteobacteria bacterium]|nr:hypothetical protein [Alphaproteobacteria bacterium]